MPLLILCVVFHLSNAQALQKRYGYKNFDNADIDIQFDISRSLIQASNQNWYSIINITPDPSKNYFSKIQAIFSSNKDSLKFVFDMFEQALPSVSDEYFINTVIRFVQTIPYKIPPIKYQGKVINGLFAPVICLAEGYGDCDTKSLLLCCILAHRYDLMFLAGARHAFIGIKVKPDNGQEYVEINGVSYVLCEMTSKWPLGVLPVSSRKDINQGKYQYQILKY